jgi:tRNA threonylcarbamoyl adenosine modification protein YeaZ
MNILAVDTAAHLCAACLFDTASRRVVGRQVEDIGRGHAERLFPVIEAAMTQASLSFDDLDRLAVCVGPGSFTGIRVAVAATRGLSLALSIPLIGVTVFECMAKSAGKGGPVLVTLDARRDEVYAQLFAADGSAAAPPQVLPPAEACQLAVRSGASLTGSGSAIVNAYREAESDPLPALDDAAAVDIACLAELAAERQPDTHQPVPLYLRSPDAKPQAGFALPRRKEAS